MIDFSDYKEAYIFLLLQHIKYMFTALNNEEQNNLNDMNFRAI